MDSEKADLAMQNRNNDNLTVAIFMVTYNHEKFISEAIKNIVTQKTNFQYKLFIGDDCSTDKTLEICKRYQNKHVDKIDIVSYPSNIGATQNALNVYERCFNSGAKYVAMCEGDDYWCDENKLQKQIDFLEANTEYTICFHRVYEKTNDIKEVSNLNLSTNEETYSILDLAEKNFIHTPSVVFVNNLFKKFPHWYTQITAADYVLHMLNGRHGKIKYLPDIMAVYRQHQESFWSSLELIKRLRNWIEVLVRLIQEFNEEKNVKKLLEQQLSKIYFQYMNECNRQKAFNNLLETNELLFTQTSFFSKWWLQNVYKRQLELVLSYPHGIKSSAKHLLKTLKRKISK